MPFLTINDKLINVQGIRALKPGLSVQEACEKTKKNGLDEVYFVSGGKTYLAYGDRLNLSDLARREIPRATFNGIPADIIAYDDETNSVVEGMKTGVLKAWKDTGNSVVSAVKNVISTIGPAGSLVLGVGLIGLSAISLLKTGTAIPLDGATLGNIGKIAIQGALGAMKVIAVTGAIGMGVSGVAGAISGATEAASHDKDYSTIAAVTYEGTSPAPNPAHGTIGQLLSPEALIRK